MQGRNQKLPEPQPVLPGQARGAGGELPQSWLSACSASPRAVTPPGQLYPVTPSCARSSEAAGHKGSIVAATQAQDNRSSAPAQGWVNSCSAEIPAPLRAGFAPTQLVPGQGGNPGIPGAKAEH